MGGLYNFKITYTEVVKALQENYCTMLNSRSTVSLFCCQFINEFFSKHLYELIDLIIFDLI